MSAGVEASALPTGGDVPSPASAASPPAAGERGRHLALLAGTGCLLAGSGLLATVVATRLAARDAGAAAVGGVLSGFYLGMLLGTQVGPRVVRRSGHVRAFVAFAALQIVFTLGHELTTAAPVWWALRLGFGLCMAGIFAAVESWLNEDATPASRGRALATYILTVQAGLALGQLGYSLRADQPGPLLVLLAAMAIALGSVPVALTRTAEPRLGLPARLPLCELYRRSPVGVAGCAVSGLLLSSLHAMAPVWSVRVGFPPTTTGWLLAAMMAGGMALPWPLGAWSDRIDRTLVLIAVGLLVAAAAGAGWLLPPSAAAPARDAALLFLLGGAATAVYPLATAVANDYVASAERVEATAGLLLVYGVGSTLGPVLTGAVMTRLGPSGLHAAAGASGLALAAFVAYRRQRRPPLPAAEQSEFVALSRTTPVAVALDPGAPAEAAGSPGPAA